MPSGKRGDAKEWLARRPYKCGKETGTLNEDAWGRGKKARGEGEVCWRGRPTDWRLGGAERFSQGGGLFPSGSEGGARGKGQSVLKILLRTTYIVDGKASGKGG